MRGGGRREAAVRLRERKREREKQGERGREKYTQGYSKDLQRMYNNEKERMRQSCALN